MASIDTANLSLHDVFATRHGAKICSITDGDGDLVFQPNEYLRVPFEPSVFDKSETERLNRVFDSRRVLKEWLTQYLAEHSARLLKKRLTVDQVRANYFSCVRTSERGYPATLKTKVDVGAGKYAVVCWDDDGFRWRHPSLGGSFGSVPGFISHISGLWGPPSDLWCA